MAAPGVETAWPLWETFLDVPHPHASASCPAPVILQSPSGGGQNELSKDPNFIGKVQRFAFPEFDDRAQPPPQGGLNRYDVYVTKGFQHHAFSLQLSTGERVYGHVRRYLPSHSMVGSRSDVGRRGVRALVLLSKASGGDALYAGMLKCLEGIRSLQTSSPFVPQNPQEFFLSTCFKQHQLMCKAYLEQPPEDRKPMILTADGMEYFSQFLRGIDTNRFLVPLPLLQKSATPTSPMLPLLRCLGVANSLRVLSALLSERRVIMISSSSNRLTTCARAALSMLAQGLLHWQHLLIPVLPPHLVQYIQAPFPYLIGILSSMCDAVTSLPELGEVLLINLDRNDLETRGIPTHLIPTKIPDLFRGAMRDETLPYSGSVETSASEVLAQDLVELLKLDKRTIFGESTLGNVQENTVKAVKTVTKAMKFGFGKIKEKGRQFLAVPDDPAPVKEQQSKQGSKAAVTDDEIYTEGSQNETGEEEARVAFTTFFLCVYGNMKWYLSAPASGQTPALDRQRFLQQKRGLGDGEGSPMFPLLQNLCQTQMFEQFAKARVEEIRIRMPVSKDSPLFLVCANYHRQHHIDFNVINVRRVTRQVALANPSRLISQANANARKMAMALTSNKGFEGEQGKGVAQLVEYCHEYSVLMDVMSVVWMRLRDCKGINWRHGLFSLHILRNLLYHGPLGAVAEAADGMVKIRQLKAYKDNIRGNICQQIQDAASQVYNLLIDRAKLFSLRRSCANRRREIRDKIKPNMVRDRNVALTLSFRALHPYMNPQNNRQAPPQQIFFEPPARQYHAQAPSFAAHPVQRTAQGVQYAAHSAAQGVQHASHSAAHGAQYVAHSAAHGAQYAAHSATRGVQHAAHATTDLLGFSSPPPPRQQESIEVTLNNSLNISDPFAPQPAAPTQPAQHPAYAQAGTQHSSPPAARSVDPFAPVPHQASAVQSVQYAPTIVSVPPVQPSAAPVAAHAHPGLVHQHSMPRQAAPTYAQIPPQQTQPHPQHHQHAQAQAYPQHQGRHLVHQQSAHNTNQANPFAPQPAPGTYAQTPGQSQQNLFAAPPQQAPPQQPQQQQQQTRPNVSQFDPMR